MGMEPLTRHLRGGKPGRVFKLNFDDARERRVARNRDSAGSSDPGLSSVAHRILTTILDLGIENSGGIERGAYAVHQLDLRSGA